MRELWFVRSSICEWGLRDSLYRSDVAMQVFSRLDIHEGYHEMELPASTTKSQNRVRRARVGVHEPSIDTSQVLAAACLASAVNLEWTLVRDALVVKRCLHSIPRSPHKKLSI